MNTLTIGVCGQVSAGKTSFINAFCCGFVGSTSLQRETFEAEVIYLDLEANYNNIIKLENEIESIKTKNENFKKDPNNVNKSLIERNKDKPITSFHGRNIRIIDFPGINDAFDKEGKFYNVLTENIKECDILLYLTNAETAFTLSSEVELFNKIRTLVNNVNKTDKNVELIIVVNKFDNPLDSELIKISNEIPNKIGVKSFNISSHKLLINTLKVNKVNKQINNSVKSEFSKILKNANVNVTKQLINEINSNEQIDFSKLEYNEVLLDTSNNLIRLDLNTGDWNNIIEYISDYDQVKPNYINCVNYFKQLMSKNTYNDYGTYSSLILTWQRIEKYFINENFNEIITILYDVFTNSPKTSGQLYFYSLVKNINNEQIKNVLVSKILLNDSVTDLWVLIYLHVLKNINNVKVHNKLLETTYVWYSGTGSPFKYTDIEIVNHNQTKYTDSVILTETITVNNVQFNPVLSKIYSNCDIKLKLMIDLAFTPYLKIKNNTINKKVNYGIIDKYDHNLVNSFNLRITDFNTFICSYKNVYCENITANGTIEQLNSVCLKNKLFQNITVIIN